MAARATHGDEGDNQISYPSDLALEELAHDAEREPLLQLAAAGRERAQTGVAAGLREQPRLADPRRTLDHHEP